MTRHSDLQSEMAERLYLDADTEDRLLAGRVAPDDAPPAYAGVAAFLETLGSSMPSPDAAAADETILTMVKALQGTDRGASRTHQRRGRLGRMIAAFALATALAGTTAAFAGVLPDPAQSFASHLLARFGLSVPDPMSDPADRTANAGSTPSTQPTPSPAIGEGGTGAALPLDGDGAARDGGTAAGGTHSHQPDVATSGADPSPRSPVSDHGGSDTADAASGGREEAGTSTADRASRRGLVAADDLQRGETPSR
jgi:hypothetical protein